MSTTQNNKKHPFDVLKEKGLLAPIVAAICALLVGIIVGANVAGGDSKQQVAQAKPAPAVTVTATPAAEVVEKTTVPEACTKALDEADHGFDLASDMANEFQGAITAIQNGDLDGMKDATKNIKSINTSLGLLSPDYNADKLVCRAAAE
jgi:uncharacterized protein involved in copper resistance